MIPNKLKNMADQVGIKSILLREVTDGSWFMEAGIIKNGHSIGIFCVSGTERLAISKLEELVKFMKNRGIVIK